MSPSSVSTCSTPPLVGLGHLCDDVIEHILSHLSCKSALAVERVNRAFQRCVRRRMRSIYTLEIISGVLFTCASTNRNDFRSYPDFYKEYELSVMMVRRGLLSWDKPESKRKPSFDGFLDKCTNLRCLTIDSVSRADAATLIQLINRNFKIQHIFLRQCNLFSDQQWLEVMLMTKRPHFRMLFMLIQKPERYQEQLERFAKLATDIKPKMRVVDFRRYPCHIYHRVPHLLTDIGKPNIP